MGILDGVHTGVVKSTRRSDCRGIPFGYIKDDNPLIEDQLFFRNFGGEFGLGDEVAYRARTGTPSPVAYGVLRKDEIDELVDRQTRMRL